MQVLVTGAYGQLGKEIEKLSSQFAGMDFLFTDADTFDITDRDAVCSFFEKNTPDFVVNCAAYTAVDRAETDHEPAHLVNAVAPGYIAHFTNGKEIKLIHISTDYVFDGKSFTPYTEKDKPNPSGIYGRTKLEGEQNLLKEDPYSMVIRTSWLYSAFGNNFVKTIRRLATEREELKVVFDQLGSPTHAADLAQAILIIIENSVKSPDAFVPGIYHYSNEGVASWYDLSKAVVELSGIRCRIRPVRSDEFPTLAQRPPFSVLDKSVFKSTFGIKIPYWRESLKDCIKILESKHNEKQ